MIMKSAATAIVAAAAFTGLAAAQDYSLSPNFGEVSLSAGFAPDPYGVSIVAGGSVNASNVGCARFHLQCPGCPALLVWRRSHHRGRIRIGHHPRDQRTGRPMVLRGRHQRFRSGHSSERQRSVRRLGRRLFRRHGECHGLFHGILVRQTKSEQARARQVAGPFLCGWGASTAAATRTRFSIDKSAH